MRNTFIVTVFIANLLLVLVHRVSTATITSEMKGIYKKRLIAGPGGVVDATLAAVPVEDIGEEIDVAVGEEVVNIGSKL